MIQTLEGESGCWTALVVQRGRNIDELPFCVFFGLASRSFRRVIIRKIVHNVRLFQKCE